METCSHGKANSDYCTACAVVRLHKQLESTTKYVQEVNKAKNDILQDAESWRQESLLQHFNLIEEINKSQKFAEALIHAKHAIKELISDIPSGEWTSSEKIGWKGIGEDALVRLEKALGETP